MMSSAMEDVQLEKLRVLDQSLNTLYKKRFATLMLHQDLNFVKKGSAKEIGCISSHRANRWPW
ncbi:hypothetical protein Hanom_Chr05g00426061 [Helianthus anomalus]